MLLGLWCSVSNNQTTSPVEIESPIFDQYQQGHLTIKVVPEIIVTDLDHRYGCIDEVVSVGVTDLVVNVIEI